MLWGRLLGDPALSADWLIVAPRLEDTRIRVGAGAFNACGPGSFMETIFLLA